MVFLWNVARRDEEEPFVCAIHNFDQFCPNEEVTLFWKRARFLSQVLVHCTQYPSLCSFTRALLSTSAISGLCASSFKQFILHCPSWQKVKDLFENKKSLSYPALGEMSFKVVWEYWRWEKESNEKTNAIPVWSDFDWRIYIGVSCLRNQIMLVKNHRFRITGFSAM